MTLEDQAKILFTVESTAPFINHPHNARFRVHEELHFFRDENPSRSITLAEERYSSTPVPELQSKTYLCFTVDNIGDQSRFVFGNKREDCDVYITAVSKISKTLFSLDLENNGSTVMLSNLANRGLHIESPSYGRTRFKTRRVLVPGEKVTINTADFTIDIQHIKHEHDAAVIHRLYLQQLAPRLAQAPPVLNTLTLEPKKESSTQSNASRPYHLISKVGSGAFGTVWRAVEARTGKLVAIKVFHGSKSSSTSTPLNEAAILERLDHVNIVKFIEFISLGSGPGQLVMELVDHDNLEDAHERRPLAMHHIKDLTSELLYGLEYLHSKRITHRDLKPANILLMSYEPLRIKMTDFGLAVGRSNELTTFAGSLPYLAPEVHRKSRNYTNKVDMWSAGVVALWLAHGLPKYPAGQHEQWPELLHQRLELAVNRLFYDFVKCLLQAQADRRPTAHESLQDRFLHIESNFADTFTGSPTEYAPTPSEYRVPTSPSHEALVHRSQNAPSPPSMPPDFDFGQTQLFAAAGEISQALTPRQALPVVMAPARAPIMYWKLEHAGKIVLYSPGDELINITQLTHVLGYVKTSRWTSMERKIGNLHRTTVLGGVARGTYVSMTDAQRVLQYLKLETNLLQRFAKRIAGVKECQFPEHR